MRTIGYQPPKTKRQKTKQPPKTKQPAPAGQQAEDDNNQAQEQDDGQTGL